MAHLEALPTMINFSGSLKHAAVDFEPKFYRTFKSAVLIVYKWTKTVMALQKEVRCQEKCFIWCSLFYKTKNSVDQVGRLRNGNAIAGELCILEKRTVFELTSGQWRKQQERPKVSLIGCPVALYSKKFPGSFSRTHWRHAQRAR